MQWCKPAIPALGRLRQDDCEFKAWLSYIMKPCPNVGRGRRKEDKEGKEDKGRRKQRKQTTYKNMENAN
jgi:hypothetical protein